jgi:peptide/nickel transport system ATP-binding protein
VGPEDGVTLLAVRDLQVELASRRGAPLRPVDGVSFEVGRGEALALVGDSGSGKSLTCLAVLRLLPPGGRVLPGSAIALDGRDVLALPEAALREVRGGQIGLVFQHPGASLNPVLSVGTQVVEAVVAHRSVRGPGARDRAVALLREVGLPDPEAAYHTWPHQLSGGLQQRVMIAIALAGDPAVLIADEPTSALDVTTQAQILDLLDRLRLERGMAVVLVTHDLSLAAGRTDRVAVMAQGRVVETGPTAKVLNAPSHPRTRALVASIPRLDAATPGSAAHQPSPSTPMLEVRDLVKHYHPRGGSGRRTVYAVNGVSFGLSAGETLGLVGESGCGKSTVGRAVLHLEAPSAGQVRFQGWELARLPGRALRTLRRKMQPVFQDPYGSLDPHLTVGQSIAEGLIVHRLAPDAELGRRVESLLAEVGLEADTAGRYPHEFSGGQRQRVGIARALAVAPALLVCDEPVSSLDVAARSQILGLLADLQRRWQLSYLLISHDLAVVRQLARRIVVMHFGLVVEVGPADEVVSRPRHPYTRALVSAVPRPDQSGTGARIVLAGDPPRPTTMPPGCPFASRCYHPSRDRRCHTERPTLRAVGETLVACHYAELDGVPHDHTDLVD